jgi:hypothetical protein
MPDIQKDLMVIMMQKYMPEVLRTMQTKIEENKKVDKKTAKSV